MQFRNRRGTLASSVLAVTVVCAGVVAGCMPNDRSAQGAAEVFVDKHYVQMDPMAAEPFCVGLALVKLQQVRKLTEGLVVDATAKRPTVRYEIIEAKEEAAEATYVFQGTIYVEDDEPLARRWIVSTRKEGDVWRVSNFTEEYE